MTIMTPIKPAKRSASLSARIEAVRKRHRRIDDSVAAEQSRPNPCMAALQTLKRQRLRLKDELQHYEGLMRTLSRGGTAA